MGYLRHIHAINQWNPAAFIPFAVGDTQYGWMRPAFARELYRFPATFIVQDNVVVLHPALCTFEARNSAVAEVLDELVREGVLDHVMGELFPVLHAWGEQPAFLIDRAAVSAFGTRSFGQHLNGIVPTESGVSMWIGRRAADRYTYPDQLDQLVAGGLPFGIAPLENLAKECEEEAGMKPKLAARAVATGLISYRLETAAGLRSDTIFCYDITLPESFTPVCNDGEVGEFYLWPVEEVARVVRETDEFKLNCNLVVRSE
ncbi:MAG: DUF4743 domain-containing protein, partial [Mariprofundaceae bacterium]|nr:DUF4743 domain-containing protein [Mariprofundaceae bacterium]